MNRWNRHMYPVQSSSADSLPTPPPEEEGKSPSVQLPKNIRAVEDAKEFHRKGRTIVVCLDGTGDKFDSDNSNIVHLISCLKKDDPSQATYYQAGIGTYSAGGLSSGISAALDMAVGSGLGLHVRDAYHFLMHTYKEGDKICIFGFSRGAYTARCLAGMVHKVGLLPPRNIEQIPFAYEFYANDTPEGWKQSEEFKKAFCIDVSVYFLGAFDSVASVGIIPRQLPLSSTPISKSRHFRHAMALDERRAKFKICRYQAKDWEEIVESNSTASTGVAEMLAQSLPNGILPKNSSLNDTPPKLSQPLNSRKDDKTDSDAPDQEYEILTGHPEPYDTDVLEVWFLGCHADVGGGAVKNEKRHKLSHIPLRWMIRQCFECNTGIIFKTKSLAQVGLDVHTLWPKYTRLTAPVLGPPPSLIEKYEEGLPPITRRPSKLVPVDKIEKGERFYDLKIFEEGETQTNEEWLPEQVEDCFDAMSDPNDQLEQAKGWWILEVFPVAYKVPRAETDEFDTRVGMNLGRYRVIEDFEPKLHWTVRHRMNHMGYKVNARTAKDAVWQIVV